jgi:PncC family amidohydrolase
VIAAAPLGKTKTVTQMAAVTLLILQRPYPGLVPIAALAVAVAVIFTIGSGIDYLVRFRHLIGLGGRASGSSPVDPIADELGTMLIREHLTLSVAESCTGGLLGALITDRPGSSAYFLGGVIAYADEVKRDELNVPAALLTRHGAVSREVAIAMADGARARFASSLAISTTGIAGPDSDGSSKPVGLTYIAVASEVGRRCEEFRFTGDRWSNRRQAVAEALRILVEEAQAVAGRQKSRPA